MLSLIPIWWLLPATCRHLPLPLLLLLPSIRSFHIHNKVLLIYIAQVVWLYIMLEKLLGRLLTWSFNFISGIKFAPALMAITSFQSQASRGIVYPAFYFKMGAICRYQTLDTKVLISHKNSYWTGYPNFPSSRTTPSNFLVLDKSLLGFMSIPFGVCKLLILSTWSTTVYRIRYSYYEEIRFHQRTNSFNYTFQVGLVAGSDHGRYGIEVWVTVSGVDMTGQFSLHVCRAVCVTRTSVHFYVRHIMTLNQLQNTNTNAMAAGAGKNKEMKLYPVMNWRKAGENIIVREPKCLSSNWSLIDKCHAGSIHVSS